MKSVDNVLQVWRDLLPLVHNRTPKTIEGRYLVIGAGGVGSWVSILLSMTADITDFELFLIDNDRLELANANRLPYPIWWFSKGVAKTEALKSFIKMMRPGLKIVAYTTQVNDYTEDVIEDIVRQVDLIIDAVDSMQTIKRIWRLAKRLDKPVISAHYDGWHGSVIYIPPNSEAPTIWGDDAEGYTAPSIVVTPVMLASIVVTLIASRDKLPNKIIHYAW